jgi:hypothetical protein
MCSECRQAAPGFGTFSTFGHCSFGWYIIRSVIGWAKEHEDEAGDYTSVVGTAQCNVQGQTMDLQNTNDFDHVASTYCLSMCSLHIM